MRPSKRQNSVHLFSHLLRSLAILVSGGTMLVGLVLVFNFWRSGEGLWKQLTSWATATNAEPEVDVRSIVVQQVKDASELTTAIYTMEAVVPTQQDATVAGMVVGTTKLLYIAYGEVRAGVDLSQVTVQDVKPTEKSVTLRLPPPKLLDSKIDVAKSSVYDYNRGSLGLGPDVAPQLQTLAQQQALQKITIAACDKGLLDRANERAKLVVSQLVKLPTYPTVNVVAQAVDPKNCQPPTLPSVPQPSPSPALPSPSSSPDAPPNPTLPSPPTLPTPPTFPTLPVDPQP
ncbi:MAG: DUF4230 domain-containing protein [Synechococcales bacterium]|nr:DUF4230 domain-containing protein [Synechococcales bacterium]